MATSMPVTTLPSRLTRVILVNRVTRTTSKPLHQATGRQTTNLTSRTAAVTASRLPTLQPGSTPRHHPTLPPLQNTKGSGMSLLDDTLGPPSFTSVRPL